MLFAKTTAMVGSDSLEGKPGRPTCKPKNKGKALLL